MGKHVWIPSHGWATVAGFTVTGPQVWSLFMVYPIDYCTFWDNYEYVTLESMVTMVAQSSHRVVPASVVSEHLYRIILWKNPQRNVLLPGSAYIHREDCVCPLSCVSDEWLRTHSFNNVMNRN
jgi:hypothetical protein